MRLDEVDPDALSRALQHVYTNDYPSEGRSVHADSSAGIDPAHPSATNSAGTNPPAGTEQITTPQITGNSLLIGNINTSTPLNSNMPNNVKDEVDLDPVPPIKSLFGSSAHTQVFDFTIGNVDILDQDISVYLCAEALKIESVMAESKRRVLSICDAVIAKPATLTRLTMSFSRVYKASAGGVGSLRDGITEVCLKNYEKCEQNHALSQLLKEHERVVWTLAMPLLRAAHQEHVVACQKCSHWSTVRLKSNLGFGSTTNFEINCKICSDSHHSVGANGNTDPAQQSDGIFSSSPSLAKDKNASAVSTPSFSFSSGKNDTATSTRRPGSLMAQMSRGRSSSSIRGLMRESSRGSSNSAK